MTDGADAFGFLLLLTGLLVLIVGGRLDLALAFVALDAVAVKQPESGPREKPRQHNHVAAERFEEQSPRVLRVEVVQVGDN